MSPPSVGALQDFFFDVYSSSNMAAAEFTTPEIHYFWPPQNLQRSKYTISGRRGFCSARNTLFLAVADFAMLEIHYFWPSQILQCSKYTISGRRRFCNARNTLFLVVAEFTMLEIHYFWLSQILQRPKYTISGCRRFCNARNTLFLAVADLQQPVAVFDAPPARDNAQLATVPLERGDQLSHVGS